MSAMWGIRNDAVPAEQLVDEGFVSIGWGDLGDLRAIGDDQAAMRLAIEARYPTAKTGAIPVWAGVVRRFAFEMKIGDLVLAPNGATSTLNFGVVSGEYEFQSEAQSHQHRRKVTWQQTGVPRPLFSQSALYAIGAALTLFRVRNHESEFRQFLGAGGTNGFPVSQASDTSAGPVSHPDGDWASEEPSAAKLDQFARDFVLKSLLSEITHEEFEHFTADLLRAMGYEARVTQFVADGGVDVIAHRDPLGLEPPLIKVQCKHTAQSQGSVEVNQLKGTLSGPEQGLFVALGSYTKDALSIERQRSDLRLLGGVEVAELTLQHYEELPAKWRSRIPLRKVYVVDRDAEGY